MTSINRNGYNSNNCPDELSYPVLMHDQSALIANRSHLRQPDRRFDRALAAHRFWLRLVQSARSAAPVEKKIQVVVSNAASEKSVLTPTFRRIGVVEQMTAQANSPLLKGRTLALLRKLGLADPEIAAWPAKYAYNFWRSMQFTWPTVTARQHRKFSYRCWAIDLDRHLDRHQGQWVYSA